MTTTYTDALTERIAEMVCGARYRGEPVWTDNPQDYRVARLILPIVDAEVRKAKAEALRKAAGRILTHPPIDRYGRVMTGARAAAKEVDRLADEYETGGNDDRR